MIKRCLLAALLCLLAILGTACSPRTQGWQDGYYTAEAAEFDTHGWKEFVTIYVRNGRIITIEYEAKNASGFIKSWDMDYMRIMEHEDGTYPNEYVRNYESQLLVKQDAFAVDAVSGATHSHGSFQLLVQAAMEKAEAGDTHVAFVLLPVAEDEAELEG